MQHNKKNDMLIKLRDRLMAECTLCDKTGWIGDTMCKCRTDFQRYMLLDDAGIDREYWDVTFDDWKGDQVARHLVEKYIAKLDVAYEEGLGIVFWGNTGTGKTMLCSIILKQALTVGKSIRFITMAELLDVFRKKIENKDIEKHYEENIKNVDFLCIDNLGSEYGPKKAHGSYSVAEFDLLARYRKRNLLPTLLTTNDTPDVFKEQYGAAISSLYAGCSAFIEVTGHDFRTTQNKFDALIK
jgi:DNA replication protein DnaC